jgi:hypothetical protein
MNPSPSSSTPPKDLFFRLADRLQIDACLEAIEQEGKSVILHGISPGLLDHYSQILVQRLRKRLPDTPTEIFFPTHTEALIARFNDLLEDVSVDAATQSRGSQAPQKLWIVHDASALPEHELKLLLRLLQHLPGARVSAVLVLNGQAAGLRNLDPQGRRLMRWEIEPPTQAQTDQMVEEARQAGREFAALELIARLQTTPPVPARETTRPPLAPAALGAIGTATPEPASANPATAAAPVRRSGGRTLAFVVAGLLLALSAGVASWLHPEVLQGLIGSVARSPASPAVTSASEAAPAASSPASEAASAAASEASAASEAASAPVILASEAQSSASTPSAVAASAASPAASAPAQATSAPKVISELPDAAQNGLQWLRKLEADTWVIEHGRHSTSQAARRQIDADKLLSNARIVPVVQPGADTAQFLVVTGPFRSVDRARNYMARNELGKSAALHDVNTLKTLTPSGTSTPRRP